MVTKCSKAADASLKAYDVNMKSRLSGQLPCDNEEIRKSHEAAIEKGIAQLKADTFGISTITTEEYLRKLTVRKLNQYIKISKPNIKCLSR